MPNQPTPDKLDKIIRIACTEAIAALHPEGGEFPLDSRIVDNAKQAILQLYREWAMELVGEDEVYNTGDDYFKGQEAGRNQLRAELHLKLQESTNA